jgi:dipeptidyl aminopeptidase/acylaminoacyl peptidase
LKLGTYGDSIKDIIMTTNQYAHNQQSDSEIQKLAKQLLAGEKDDMTQGATHFFSAISMPKEGESTVGFDIGGGLHVVTGINSKVYFPSWTETMNYVADLYNVRPSYFMFYRAGEIIQEQALNPAQEVRVPSGKIIFKREGNLYTANADGTNEIEIERGGEIVEKQSSITGKIIPAETSIEEITPSPDGKKIVYEIDFQGTGLSWRELYIINNDGMAKIKIDEGIQPYNNIRWSPDGKMVSYTTHKSYPKISIWPVERLVVFNTETGDIRDIDNPSYYQWSPDGKRIVYQNSEEDWRIQTIEGNELQLEEEMASPVCWSADGKKIYYTEKSQGNLASINSDGTGKTRVIPSSVGSGLKIVDVTDEKIIFATFYEYRDNPISWGNTLWDANIDGTNQRKLISVEDYIIYHGEKIAVTTYSYPSGGGDYLILDLETLEETQLEQMPEAFSSDGKWIAYSEKDEWGDWYIYIVNPETMTKIKFVEGSYVYAWVP